MKIRLLIILLALGFTLSLKANNVSYQDATVRFTVITDGVIRMEYSPNGEFTDDKSFVAVEREYSAVNYKIKKGSWVEITTSKMRLRYKKNSGAFNGSNLLITNAKGTFPFIWKPGMKQQGNLKGTARTLDGVDGDVQTFDWLADSRKGDIIRLEDGLLATDGWTLIDDSRSLLFNNDTDWNWVKERSGVANQDWYFMAYGHDYKAALKDFTVLAGKIPLPPHYAFGYWWSRNWAYSDKEIRELLDNFDTYDIPLDVLVIDMDWHYTDGKKGGWTGWTWNKRLFPNPPEFLKYLKDRGLKVTLNLHPCDGIAAYEERYPEFAADMGIDTSAQTTIPWRGSDKRFMTYFFQDILHPLEKEGVDFWWLDWQQGINDQKIKNLSNTWWLNYTFFTDMEKHRETRPLMFHRWGGLGNHRYQIGFSGDMVITWKSLNYQPYFNSTASNVLYGYWSHDLGGYIGDSINAEMYTRWMQFGALSPIMRTHATKKASLIKDPWKFDHQYTEALISTVQQRYAMIPYIYTMARKAYDDGLSLCRPLYYDYPEKQEAYEYKNEYMFGDDILVAPITSPEIDGYTTMSIWLPEGEWYEWHSGTIIKGGKVIKRSFALDEYPIYVKAGAVLPMYAGKMRNLTRNDEPIAVTVFPGGNGAFSFYEDNGNDKHYADEYATTALTSVRNGNCLTVTIGKRKGSYKDMPVKRKFVVKIMASVVPSALTINGVPVTYEYLGDEFAVKVVLPDSSCNAEKVLKIIYPERKLQIDNGLLGKTRRFSKAVEQLKSRDESVNFNEEFGVMGSVNEAVHYNPEKLPQWIETFQKSYNDLPGVLQRQGLSKETINWFLRTIKY